MFIDFSGSVEPLKELINEILKMSGSALTADDIVSISIRPEWWDDNGVMEDYGIENWENWKPDGESSTIIHVEAKEEQYKPLVERITRFIESADMNEYMC